LFLACQYGSVKLVERIIATGAAKIDQTDQDNWSPLFIACLRGHTKVVEKLLEVGADPEIRENRFGWTPLLATCFAGHAEIARMLIAHAAKIGSYMWVVQILRCHNFRFYSRTATSLDVGKKILDGI